MEMHKEILLQQYETADAVTLADMELASIFEVYIFVTPPQQCKKLQTITHVVVYCSSSGAQGYHCHRNV